jgi:hypothetical protein
MRGMKWVMEMEMEMVLILMMETPEGGWRSLSEVILRCFPLQSSPAAADRLYVSVFSISSPPPFMTRGGGAFYIRF